MINLTLEGIVNGVHNLSRRKRNKVAPRKKHFDPFEDINESSTFLSESEIKEKGLPHSTIRELKTIAEQEKSMRADLNKPYSIADFVSSSLTAVGTSLLRNPSAPYFALYDCLVVSYGFRAAYKNYKQEGILDKVAKWTIPIAGVVMPCSYYVYLDRTHSGTGMHEWTYMGIQLAYAIARAMSDSSRRKNEKIIERSLHLGFTEVQQHEAVEKYKNGNGSSGQKKK